MSTLRGQVGTATHNDYLNCYGRPLKISTVSGKSEPLIMMTMLLWRPLKISTLGKLEQLIIMTTLIVVKAVED